MLRSCRTSGIDCCRLPAQSGEPDRRPCKGKCMLPRDRDKTEERRNSIWAWKRENQFTGLASALIASIVFASKVTHFIFTSSRQHAHTTVTDTKFKPRSPGKGWLGRSTMTDSLKYDRNLASLTQSELESARILAQCWLDELYWRKMAEKMRVASNSGASAHQARIKRHQHAMHTSDVPGRYGYGRTDQVQLHLASFRPTTCSG